MADRLKTLQDNDGNTIYPNTVSASVLSNDGITPLSKSLGSNNIEPIGSGTITSAIAAISKYSTYPPYVSEGKEKIAEAITQKGVTTYGTDEFEVMANNIMNINRVGIPYQEKSIMLDTKKPSVEVIPDVGYDWLTKVKASIDLENKTVSINHGLLTVEPDDGKVINTVLINGPVDRGAWTNSLDTTTTEVTIPEGYHNGNGKVGITTQSKTTSLNTNTTSVTVKPDSGKVLNQVIASITTQSKSVSLDTSKTSVTVKPDSGKVLSQVTANIDTQSKSITVNSTGTTTVTPDSGKVLSQVTVTANVPTVSTQSKSTSISYGSTTVYPDSGYYLSSVTVNGPTNNGAWIGYTTDSGNVTIPEGYHNGSGYVSGEGAYNAGYIAGNDAGYNSGYSSGYSAGQADNKILAVAVVAGDNLSFIVQVDGISNDNTNSPTFIFNRNFGTVYMHSNVYNSGSTSTSSKIKYTDNDNNTVTESTGQFTNGFRSLGMQANNVESGNKVQFTRLGTGSGINMFVIYK